MLLFLSLYACGGKTTDSSSSDTHSTNIDCTTLEADECSSYDACTDLRAHSISIDEQNMCYDLIESISVGCISMEMTCDDAITFATNPQGTTYWFSSSCIPSGWSETQDLQTYQEGCETQSIDCEALSTSECLNHDGCTHISDFERFEDDAQECYSLQEAQPLSCMSTEEACEPVVLNMQDPTTGSCYQINHGCTPTRIADLNAIFAFLKSIQLLKLKTYI